MAQAGTVDCEGAGPQQCDVVSESADGETQLFYDSIAGFDPDDNTAYVIDVRVDDVDDPPADGSSKKYTLVDIVDETPGA